MDLDGTSLTTARISISEYGITLQIQGEITLVLENKRGIISNSSHKLILENERRLQILKERQAKLGISTPPEVITEIEDIEEQIANLRDE